MAVNQEKQRREAKRKVKEVLLRKASYSKSLYHLHHHNTLNRHFVQTPLLLGYLPPSSMKACVALSSHVGIVFVTFICCLCGIPSFTVWPRRVLPGRTKAQLPVFLFLKESHVGG